MKVAQKKGLQFYQTRSNAIILCNTWPATRIEKVVCMKSREELYNKVHPSPRLPPKSVLKPNLCHGRQDSYNFEARTSVDHQSKEREAHGETRGDSNSYRRTEEFVRRETVKQMIHQFETHPNRESLMADSEKNPKLNPFSEKSKEFIRCMGKNWVLRDVRDHFWSTLPRLLALLGNRHCMLYLRLHACDLHKRIAIWTKIDLMSCQSRIL